MAIIQIEGVEIELKACGHCNSIPSELDAGRALQKAKEFYRTPCPACGLELKISSLVIEHRSRSSNGGEAFWKLTSVELGNAVGLEVHGYKRTWIHQSCIEKVFANRLERGSVWRPWDEDSVFTIS